MAERLKRKLNVFWYTSCLQISFYGKSPRLFRGLYGFSGDNHNNVGGVETYFIKKTQEKYQI